MIDRRKGDLDVSPEIQNHPWMAEVQAAAGGKYAGVDKYTLEIILNAHFRAKGIANRFDVIATRMEALGIEAVEGIGLAQLEKAMKAIERNADIIEKCLGKTEIQLEIEKRTKK